MNIASQIEVFGWKPACWLRVGGSDAASFLQGQFTNDLKSIGSNHPSYGLWLNLKGKVLADSFIFPGRTAGEFWIGSMFSPAATIRERLESHIIADDVTIEDQTGQWAGMTVFGGAPDNLPKPVLENGFAFPGRRGRAAHRELVFRTDDADEVQTHYGSPRGLEPSEMERRRIEAGIPAIPLDIGPTDLPNEGGLDADAISYTKGCYLGQEVMARLKSMGQVRRRLLRVAGPAHPISALPAPLFAAGRQVGELRSAVVTGHDLLGLAMLTLMHLPPDNALAFAVDAEPKLRVVDPR